MNTETSLNLYDWSIPAQDLCGTYEAESVEAAMVACGCEPGLIVWDTDGTEYRILERNDD